MQETTDIELLRQYTDRNSDLAFATLVSRHVNLVYSTALRKTGQPAEAEEITQAVFILLAQKARRLPDRTILTGWLYQATRLTAANFFKREIRRVKREQEAYMQAQIHDPATDETWQQLAPLLDDAMGRLGEKDRAAVLLRFFEGKSFAEVAAAAGINENTAKKRVNYALQKLHRYFSRRGVSSTTAIIAGTLSTHSVQAAPALLTKSVATMAIAQGIVASTSKLSLLKAALKLMTWTKIKTALPVALGLLIATGGTLAITDVIAQNNQSAALKLLEKVETQYASLPDYSYDGRGLFRGHTLNNDSEFSVRLGRPGFYRTERQTNGKIPSQNVYWSTADSSFSYASWQTNAYTSLQTNKLYKIKSTPESRSQSYRSLYLDQVIASCLPTFFFFYTNLDQPLQIFSLTNRDVTLSLLSDEPVFTTDCSRIAATLPSPHGKIKLTLWIGKSDSLIYRSEIYYPKADTIMKNSEETSYPATQTENYRNLDTNGQFTPRDFIPDDVPANLQARTTFP
jgi:RNA polymerase sigma factor (sigma-70 family)